MSPKPDDLCFLSAVVLAARIRAGKVSPVEVIDALRDRIGKVNPKLNAYVTLDLENARMVAEMKHKWQREHPGATWGHYMACPWQSKMTWRLRDCDSLVVPGCE